MCRLSRTFPGTDGLSSSSRPSVCLLPGKSPQLLKSQGLCRQPYFSCVYQSCASPFSCIFERISIISSLPLSILRIVDFISSSQIKGKITAKYNIKARKRKSKFSLINSMIQSPEDKKLADPCCWFKALSLAKRQTKCSDRPKVEIPQIILGVKLFCLSTISFTLNLITKLSTNRPGIVKRKFLILATFFHIFLLVSFYRLKIRI